MKSSSRIMLHLILAILILTILVVFQFLQLRQGGWTNDSLGDLKRSHSFQAPSGWTNDSLGGHNRSHSLQAPSGWKSDSLNRSHSLQAPSFSYNGQCALLFFGLPRAYKTMVLPSIKRYLLEPNARHHCDVYVHYFHKMSESAGRRNRGGTIDPKEIFLLEGVARNISSSPDDNTDETPILVEFDSDTDESFQELLGSTLQKYHDTLGKDGKPAYFPYRTVDWGRSSLDNMVKQWHSIQSVFQLMETTSKKHNKTYDRVGMFRSDVMYMTPIDIARLDLGVTDTYNQYAVVPSFCQYPVNDRMIYGPTQAVRIWATQRFQLIEDRVKQASDPGFEMHSETFMKKKVFPTIETLSNTSIHLNRDICFARTRSDYSVMVGDCLRSGRTRGWKHVNTKKLVESIVGRPCTEFRDSPEKKSVGCGIGMEHLYK
jgi:hypothetical protein